MRDAERCTAGPTIIDMRRAADRFHTQLPWLDSKHASAFPSVAPRATTTIAC